MDSQDENRLTHYFLEGARWNFGSEVIATVEVKEIGELLVESGKIVSCDPTKIGGKSVGVFTESVAVGKYPVLISRVNLKNIDGSDFQAPRNTGVLVKFKDIKVVNWHPALVESEGGPIQLDQVEMTEEGVGLRWDSGYSCFCDQVCLNNESLKDKIAECLVEIRDNRKSSGIVQSENANIVIFPTTDEEFEDSPTVFESFWGTDQAGEIVALITRFHILDGATVELSK
jgi:hypothetical protein